MSVGTTITVYDAEDNEITASAIVSGGAPATMWDPPEAPDVELYDVEVNGRPVEGEELAALMREHGEELHMAAQEAAQDESDFGYE